MGLGSLEPKPIFLLLAKFDLRGREGTLNVMRRSDIDVTDWDTCYPRIGRTVR